MYHKCIKKCRYITLEPEHVAENKLIVIGVVCECFDKRTCDLTKQMGMSRLKINNIVGKKQLRGDIIKMEFN